MPPCNDYIFYAIYVMTAGDFDSKICRLDQNTGPLVRISSGELLFVDQRELKDMCRHLRLAGLSEMAKIRNRA